MHCDQILATAAHDVAELYLFAARVLERTWYQWNAASPPNALSRASSSLQRLATLLTPLHSDAAAAARRHSSLLAQLTLIDGDIVSTANVVARAGAALHRFLPPLLADTPTVLPALHLTTASLLLTEHALASLDSHHIAAAGTLFAQASSLLPWAAEWLTHDPFGNPRP